MQMQDLNKTQIVLLTLLISFVTSIATGIMTVSLLQEAPLEVTRNINRIVEKTIETVTPATILAPQQKETTTVVVKEEDLIIDSINKNIKSITRIKERDGNSVVTFYGIGLVVSKDGLIGTDRKPINSTSAYNAVMSDGTEFELVPQGVDKQTNFILFKARQPEKISYSFVPAQLGVSEPKLGQTMISLEGETENLVSVGRVSSLEIKESGTGTSTTKYLASIGTDIVSKDSTVGGPLFNLSGDVVGVKLSLDSLKSFTPISVLKKELGVLIES